MMEFILKHSVTGKRWAQRAVGCLLAVCLVFGSYGVPVLAEESEEETSVLLPGGEDTYNLLLIGSDRREDSWNGNSDVMILVTVNPQTSKIILTSFMRDLYADIPGYGVHKLNYAYAVSGADTLIETLEDNYELSIQNYAAVDFDTMAEIIDLLGGVEIELNEAEIGVMGSSLSSEQVEQAQASGGVYSLDGAQAVTYMRIRKVGNSDYERTERQRRVLSALFTTIQEKNTAELAGLAEEVLELTDHDISVLDMVVLTAALPTLMTYTLEENRVPYDGLYTSQDEMLVPDFPATIEKLHETLYGTEEETE